MSVLQGASILVTGGTGSFGKSFIRHVLDSVDPRRLVVFSRDELKQYECRQLFDDDKRLRWFIGDVRDERRLLRALHGVDYVVHAAALKQVDTGEYNPFEFVQTNVIGSQNVIEAAIDAGVKRVVALSTDKASSPINLYGATKLTADKLFFITLPQAVQFVVDSFDLMSGGELYVPRIPSMKITDLAQAIAPGARMHDVGLRVGEKLHEEMISPEEGRRALRLEDRYLVQPDLGSWGWQPPPGGVPVEDGFFYRSDSNDQWYSREQIAQLVASGI